MSENKMMGKTPTHKKCWAKDCDHRQNTHICIFFAFPKNSDRCKKWLQVVGVKDFVSTPIEKLSTIRFICSCHFKPEELTKSGKKLSGNAIPSIFSKNTVPLTEAEVNEFSANARLTVVPTIALRVPLEEFKQSTQYSFHKMFNQLKNEQPTEQLIRDDGPSEVSSLISKPSLCDNNDESVESSNIRERSTISRKRSLSSMELLPLPKKMYCRSESLNPSIPNLSDMSVQPSVINEESVMPSTSKQISYSCSSELLTEAHGEKFQTQKKIITTKIRSCDWNGDSISQNELLTSFMIKLQKCVYNLDKSAVEQIVLKLNNILDAFNI